VNVWGVWYIFFLFFLNLGSEVNVAIDVKAS